MLLAVVFLILCLCIGLAVWMPGVGLIASPILGLVCVGLALFGQAEPNIGALVLALAIFPAVLVLLKIRSRRARPPRWPYVVVNWILTLSWYGLGLAVLIALFQPFGPILFALFVGFTIRHKWLTRKALTFDVVSTISAGIRQNLPLAMTLDSAAEGDASRTGQVLRHVSHWLKSGYSLSEAVQMGFPRCPADVLTTITVAEKIHQLPGALRSLEKDMIEDADEQRRIRPVNFIYPVVVLSCAALLVLGLMIFILPTYVEVYRDAGEDGWAMPRSTQILLSVTKSLWAHPVLVALVLLTVPGTWAMDLLLRRMRRKRLCESSALLYLRDWAFWHMPLQRWFEHKYSLLRTIRLLRTSLRAGCPVDQAVENTLNLATNLCFRKRLRLWHEQIRTGQTVSKAAARAGVDSALVWAFDDQVNQGSALSILGMLEEAFRSDYNYRAALARSAAGPVTILLLGCTVGCVVYALYMPIVQLNRFWAGMIVPLP